MKKGNKRGGGGNQRSRPLTPSTGRPPTFQTVRGAFLAGEKATIGNDPSAGSPTETLLRLLLPLNDQV